MEELKHSCACCREKTKTYQRATQLLAGYCPDPQHTRRWNMASGAKGSAVAVHISHTQACASGFSLLLANFEHSHCKASRPRSLLRFLCGSSKIQYCIGNLQKHIDILHLAGTR